MAIDNIYVTIVSLLTALNKEYNYSIAEIFENIQFKKEFTVYSYYLINALSCVMIILIITAMIVLNYLYANLADFIAIDNKNFVHYIGVILMNIMVLRYDLLKISEILDRKFGISTYVKFGFAFLIPLALMVYSMI